jgi:hypothetical protein
MQVKKLIGFVAGALIAYVLLESVKRAQAAPGGSDMVWDNGRLVPIDSIFGVSDVTRAGSQGIGDAYPSYDP